MHESAPTESTATVGTLDAIRHRLVSALFVQFIGLLGIAAIQAFRPGGLPGDEASLVVLAAGAVAVGLLTIRLVRPVLLRIETIDAERRRLISLYGRVRQDALVDTLTGLGNHRAFQEELGRQLERASRQETSLALLLIDVDDLKKVNDRHGHAGGDDLLSAVGRIALTSLRRSDRAFRVGGDEFAVLLPDTDVDTALTISRRILAAALGGGDPSRPIEGFSLSIGVSAVPTPSSEGRLLYRHADAALYWCKRHGRTAAVAYEPGRHGVVLHERSIDEMSEAVAAVIANRTLRPVYQPIFSLESGSIIGYEGLVRPTEASTIPDASTLFAAAELANRTVELDIACLRIVAAGVGTLEPDVYLSVNLSPRTLESDQFHPSELTTIFRRHGIALEQVVIELTEREAVQDLDQLRRNAAACRRAGMRLAADDVGAGNAGLRLLSEIDFDIVKIDLSLVHGEANDPTHAILGAIQELGARRRVTIVAEGVETTRQLAVVKGLGISAGQGYLLGRPTQARTHATLDIDALLLAPLDWDQERSSAA